MVHYYFYKYWSRVLVGTMVGMVVITFGLFAYSLTAAQQTRVQNALDGTNPQNALTQTQAYKKSVNLFGQIQDLKVKQQDTSQLEALYTASVQSLSNQNEKEAVTQLNQLETQIAKINESLTISPVPSGVIASISGTLTPSVAPTEATSEDSSGSAELR